MLDLHEYMERLGYSNAQMAEALGLSLRGFAYKKAGDRQVGICELRMLQILLNIKNNVNPLEGIS